MSTGLRHDDLRRRNRALVISAARQGGQPSRTAMAAATGLSHSTISTISSDLLNEGILANAQGADSETVRRGRPQVSLVLNAKAATVVTVGLSLNRLSVSVADYAGNTVAGEDTRLATLTLGREELVAAIRHHIERAIAKAGRQPGDIRRATMAIQGITDARARTLLWTPIMPHGDIAFADILEDAFGFPVTVQNDCNMIAVALRGRQPARYRDTLVAILLSNGIGMGLVLGGSLFTGSASSGGEFGHMIHRPGGALCRCGRHGCIEAYAGNYAILRKACGHDGNAAPEADVAPETLSRLAEEARAGEPRAREAFIEAGSAIGYGLGSLFALIDPAPVAIIGPGTLAFDIMEPAIREAIAETAGGQHGGTLTFDVEADERPLIAEGAALHALLAVDGELAAPPARTARAARSA